jgi:hypothetical protein
MSKGKVKITGPEEVKPKPLRFRDLEDGEWFVFDDVPHPWPVKKVYTGPFDGHMARYIDGNSAFPVAGTIPVRRVNVEIKWSYV